MDWQHLIMNREHLPEYAALLAAEGLLGHQHANSGWGDFDDDNMVGATYFLETDRARARASARTLCRAGRSARVRPVSRTRRTRSTSSGAASCTGGSSTRSPRSIDGDALREAQHRKDAMAAYEIVYAALGGS